MRDLVVCAADVGSEQSDRFGWYRRDDRGNTASGWRLKEFVADIVENLSKKRRVCLGFECPLFVPLRKDPQQLLRARTGEGNRAWSAGAGMGALVTGLVQYTWIFTEIREQLQQRDATATPTLDWKEFVSGKPNIFIWEAFVSGKSKGAFSTHVEDAAKAVNAFWKKLPDVQRDPQVTAENPFSLVGVALLRSGLSTDTNLLSQPTVVVRAQPASGKAPLRMAA